MQKEDVAKVKILPYESTDVADDASASDITKEELDLAIESGEKIKFGIEMELHDSIRFAIRDGHCYATVLASFDDEDGETVLIWEIDKGTSGDCIFEIITAPFLSYQTMFSKFEPSSSI